MAISCDEGAAPLPRLPAAERFWNLPNTITVLRVGVVPVLLLLPLAPGRAGSQVIAWIFIVAALSDLLDGWLARRGQQVTRIGKLLDPLADKLVVATALVVLVSMGRIPEWATWMVVVIIGRELAVTGLRGLASAEGQIMAASSLGKVKTLIQNVAIGALLFPDPTLGLPAHAIGLAFLAVATAITIWSGYAYFSDFFRGNGPRNGEEGTGVSRLLELGQKIDAREARIGIIGLGYVGLPLAVEFAKQGFRVTGFDLDSEKVRMLQEGRSYIEDVTAADVAEARDQQRLDATSDFGRLSQIDVIHVCVPTPLTKTKDPDMSFIGRAVEEIRKRLRGGQLVILGSTTYPGTTHDLFVPILEESGLTCGTDFAVAFAPERIDPANKKFKVRDVPKVVGGETPLCTELAVKAYEPIFDRVVPVSSSQSAELVKLLENTFRAINIGLANEVALMCHRLGLDVWEVIEAASTKPYGFMKFLPGPGLGGHCIPVDPTYLSWKMKSLNFSARFIELATEINGHMPDHVADRVADLLNEERLPVNGSSILMVGVAYKPDVSDMRESPALDVIRLLRAKGGKVSYHDPHVAELALPDATLKSVDLTEDTLSSADLVLILTDHSAIDYDRLVKFAPRVFDTRNATKGVTEGREKICKL